MINIIKEQGNQYLINLIINENMTICEECGSDKIQTLEWVEVNTNKVIGGGIGDENDRWCPICEKHVNFK